MSRSLFSEEKKFFLETFADYLGEDGKQHPLIKCKMCCLKAPAGSTHSEICEMCYDECWEDYE